MLSLSKYSYSVYACVTTEQPYVQGSIKLDQLDYS